MSLVMSMILQFNRAIREAKFEDCCCWASSRLICWILWCESIRRHRHLGGAALRAWATLHCQNKWNNPKSTMWEVWHKNEQHVLCTKEPWMSRVDCEAIIYYEKEEVVSNQTGRCCARVVYRPCPGSRVFIEFMKKSKKHGLLGFRSSRNSLVWWVDKMRDHKLIP